MRYTMATTTLHFSAHYYPAREARLSTVHDTIWIPGYEASGLRRFAYHGLD